MFVISFIIGIHNASLLFGMVYDSEANGMHLMDWSHNCSVAHENMCTSEVCKTTFLNWQHLVEFISNLACHNKILCKIKSSNERSCTPLDRYSFVKHTFFFLSLSLTHVHTEQVLLKTDMFSLNLPLFTLSGFPRYCTA